jgi:hypothetical protein
MDQISIGGVWLRREGDQVIVSVEVDNQWRDVIQEHIAGNFCHIVEPAGIAESRKFSHATSDSDSVKDVAAPWNRGVK